MNVQATWEIRTGDVIEKLREMPECSVQCVVTSPPYWGLRDYGVEGAGGLEATLAEHLAWLVEVFAEVRRVLRDDGTLWLNYGDAYAQGGRGHNSGPSSTLGGGLSAQIESKRALEAIGGSLKPYGLAAKQRIMMPARVVLALQDSGWWVRSEIVWAKGVSFCPTYSGSCMPSSVRDRPTDSHEMLYLLTKRPRYFYDGDAVRETHSEPGRKNTPAGYRMSPGESRRGGGNGHADYHPAGRNLRTVWTINPQGYKEAHFATFPEALVRPCILAGTSERGACSECGAPWRRIVDKIKVPAGLKNKGGGRGDGRRDPATRTDLPTAETLMTIGVVTTGWEPTCECCSLAGKCGGDGLCQPYPTVSCVVLDPFSGSGTTGVVALRLGRDYVGIELNPEYVAMSKRRLRNALHPEARALKVAAGQRDLFGE